MANKTETARAKCPFYEGFGKQCIKCRAREDRLVTVSFSAKNGRSGLFAVRRISAQIVMWYKIV